MTIRKKVIGIEIEAAIRNTESTEVGIDYISQKRFCLQDFLSNTDNMNTVVTVNEYPDKRISLQLM